MGVRLHWPPRFPKPPGHVVRWVANDPEILGPLVDRWRDELNWGEATIARFRVEGLSYGEAAKRIKKYSRPGDHGYNMDADKVRRVMLRTSRKLLLAQMKWIYDG